MTRTITSIPDLVAELAVVAVVVACFVILHAVLQRRLKAELLRRHNDVAGYLFSEVGVLYAVVLGFVVVVVWQKYDGAVSNVENEVDAVGNLYHVVDAFEQRPRRARLSFGRWRRPWGPGFGGWRRRSRLFHFGPFQFGRRRGGLFHFGGRRGDDGVG